MDGTINVAAKDKGTNKAQSIKINKPGLNEDEIKKMVNEAEQHAEEDKKKKDKINEKNKLDGLIYRVEKLISENKDKLEDQLVKKTNEIVANAKKCIKDEEATVGTFKEKYEKLSEAFQDLGSAIYAASKGSASTEESTEDAKSEKKEEDKKEDKQEKNEKEDDVIDVDFKDV